MTGFSEQPDVSSCTGELFGIETPWEVKRFAEPNEHVPEFDSAFRFVPEATKAILMGFSLNRRAYIYGPHGSGKSSHIEQIAARLNWPCLRINLDGHVSRADLIGRDMVLLRDGKQVTEFVPGLLVWALERPVALVFDEYDVGRPDVMFVIQRLLESQGRLTLLDQNRVITPHPAFRIFATANTAGQGDTSGLYAGTQPVNQAQMDRWHVVVNLGYMPPDEETLILQARLPSLSKETAQGMVRLATLCRQGYRQGDLSSLMSLRNLITWGENLEILSDCAEAFRLAFYNRCDEIERPLIVEFYQRCFGAELDQETNEIDLF